MVVICNMVDITVAQGAMNFDPRRKAMKFIELNSFCLVSRKDVLKPGTTPGVS